MLNKIINVELISHPLNWVIITFIVLISGLAVHLVLDSLSITPAKADT